MARRALQDQGAVGGGATCVILRLKQVAGDARRDRASRRFALFLRLHPLRFVFAVSVSAFRLSSANQRGSTNGRGARGACRTGAADGGAWAGLARQIMFEMHAYACASTCVRVGFNFFAHARARSRTGTHAAIRHAYAAQFWGRVPVLNAGVSCSAGPLDALSITLSFSVYARHVFLSLQCLC